MSNSKYAAYAHADAYFALVREALGGEVEGAHFFDVVADQITYEVRYDVAGWPRIIRGRAALMAQFAGYCEHVKLSRVDNLIRHKSETGDVVVIEYDVHGEILTTGVTYENRFCSIIKIENRKIAHWRDYMDSLAAWNALTAQAS